MNKMIITEVSAREVLDSRGNPTVEAEVVINDNYAASAMVPSGASTGVHEAAEKRDNDAERYNGRGVLNAVEAINSTISKLLVGMDASNQRCIDESMIRLDGTENKSNLGANSILAVSLATSKAAAKYLDIPLYRYIGGVNTHILPVPLMNVINGGKHADNSIDMQEFMLVPVSAKSFHDAVRMCCEVYYVLGKTIKCAGVGDEGGYAPSLESDQEALELLNDAVKKAGYKPGIDFFFALDPAVSDWYDREKKIYQFPKRGTVMERDSMVQMWLGLCEKFPIISIEDGMAEDDWEGWIMLTKALGRKIQLVGDDLFVTNTGRIKKGVSCRAANSVLIKLNQVGTLTETLDAVHLAVKSGYNAVISHRSGETEDTIIADLAVALGAGQIKTGAPARGERTSKYNRLLKIEDELKSTAVFPGKSIFEK